MWTTTNHTQWLLSDIVAPESVSAKLYDTDDDIDVQLFRFDFDNARLIVAMEIFWHWLMGTKLFDWIPISVENVSLKMPVDDDSSVQNEE